MICEMQEMFSKWAVAISSQLCTVPPTPPQLIVSSYAYALAFFPLGVLLLQRCRFRPIQIELIIKYGST